MSPPAKNVDNVTFLAFGSTFVVESETFGDTSRYQGSQIALNELFPPPIA